MFICPVPVTSTVPVPLRAPLAFTVPPLAASVPLLISGMLTFSVPAVACIRPPTPLLAVPVIDTVKAVGWLAVMVPRLFSDIAVPAPICPAPCSVCPAPSVSCAPAALATTRLVVVLLIEVVPLPASVTLPEMRRSVLLPAEVTFNAPLLVTVPARIRSELLTTLNVPLLTRLLRVAVLPLTVVIWPPLAVLRRPPLITAPPCRLTTPPLIALSTPLGPWPKLVAVITTLPPSARTWLLFVTAPVLLKTSALARSPTTVPLLVKTKFVPWPMLPAPRRVCPAPSVRLSPAARPRMTLAAVLLRLMTPVPLICWLPSTRRFVALPADCRFSTPLLDSAPRSTSSPLFCTLKVPVLLTPPMPMDWPLPTTISPPLAVAKLPPVTRAPSMKLTTPLLMALSTPEGPCTSCVCAIWKVEPSARIRLLLVALPVVRSVSALGWLASQVPLLTTFRAVPPPIWPAPCTSTPAPVVSVSAAVPKMRLAEVLDMLTVMLPVKARVPTTSRLVRLPAEASDRVALPDTLPVMRKEALFSTSSEPVRVPPASVAELPLGTAMALPAPLASSVALVTTVPLSSCTWEPFSASMLPFVLLMLTLLNCSVPPSARITPLFTRPALVDTSSGVDWLASTVPLLVMARGPPLPSCPLPRSVTPLASVSESPLALAASTRLAVVLLMSMVALPLIVRAPLMRRSVTLPAEAMLSVPL